MAKVIQIGPAEELDEVPGQVRKKKVVRIQTVGDKASN